MAKLSIAAALVAASTQDIEVAGLHWRVRSITTAQLVEAGASVLFAVRKEGEDIAALKERLMADPQKILQGMRLMEVAAAAGVIAASEDGKAWQDLRIVLDPRQEAADAGRVCVASLPPEVVAELGKAVVSLSTDGGAAGRRLASFLGRGAPGDRGARKPRR